MVTGDDLRRAREARGIGLDRLAARVGRTKGHLSKVERGIDGRSVTPALVRDYEQALGTQIPSTATGVAPRAGELLPLTDWPQAGATAAGPQPHAAAAQERARNSSMPRPVAPSAVGQPNPPWGWAGAGGWDPAASLEAVVVAVARESATHAAFYGGGVEPTSIERIQDDVLRIARSCHEMSPWQVLGAARQVRDTAYGLLGGTRRPGQVGDLFVVAGQACGLMAVASFDMAQWRAAEQQAAAAFTYADLAGHRGLRAWARGLQSLVAYWSGDAHRAVALARAGIDDAPAGAGLARLQGIHARAQSWLGDVRAVRDALHSADEAMGATTGVDDLIDGVGGEFAWGRALHSSSAGTALLQVGDGEGAADRIRAALAFAVTDPYAAPVPGRACIDLAAAELLAGRLEPAVEALGQIWVVPVEFRRQSLIGRLDAVRRRLAAGVWASDGHAAELRERIDVFTVEANQHRQLTTQT